MPGPNIVEILLVARDQASATIAKVSGELKGMDATITGMSGAGAVLGGIAIAAGVLGVAALKMGADIADAAEQLERLSKRTGVGTTDLQVMQRIVKESGGNVESLTTALSFLNRALANHDPLLKQIGITATDAFGAMRQLGEAFAKSDDAAKKNLVAFKLLGRGGADMISDVETLATSWERLAPAIRASGLVIETDVLGKANELDARLDELSRNWEGAWKRMQIAVLPVATAVADVLGLVLRFSTAVAQAGNVGAAAFLLGGGRATSFPQGGGRGEEAGAGGGGRTSASLDRVGDAASDAARGLEKVAEQFRHMIDRVMPEAKAIGGGPGQPGISGMVPVPSTQGSASQHIIADWADVVRSISEGAQQLDVVLGGLWNGMQSGFQQAAAQLIGTSQTLGSAMVTIFRSIAQQVLASLASIAASKLFGIVLQLIGLALPGGGGLVAAGIGATLGGTLGGGGGGGGAGELAPMDARVGGTTVFNINAISARDAIMDILSPAGSLRQANDRVAIQGAY